MRTPTEEFEHHCSIMTAWPYLREDDPVATATRAACAVLSNDDILGTMRTVYCDLPISPLVRSTCALLINLLDAQIADHTKKHVPQSPQGIQ